MSRPEFLADHDLNEHIVDGVLRREPSIRFVRVRQVGLDQRPDREILEYAAHLRQEPTKTSKTRIKRLRGVSRPQYRLRVDEIRVFYDVEDDAVEVLAIVPKSRAQEWLERAGESDEGDPSV